MHWNLPEPKRIVGLISGTSYDGVDAALVEVRGAGAETGWRLLAFDGLSFSGKLRERLGRVVSRETVCLEEVAKMHVLLGEVFSDAAKAAARKAGVPMESISLIASHGQTVCHRPTPEQAMGYDVAATLQLGSAAVMAERTGATVVCDFRARDMAAGGTGAPLVPFADFLMFRSESVGRICLNLGGIANVTALPAGASPGAVLGFDTGPGNSLLDVLAERVSGGREMYDHEGRRAASGRVRKKLLTELMKNPYLAQPPPKSTGRGEFGESLVSWMFTRAPGAPFEDMLATAARFTVESVARALEDFVLPRERFRELVVSGGGLRNTHLMALLRERLDLTVRTSDELGVPADAKEAVAFALLGNETMAGRAGNVPSATGARRAVVLGSIVPGRGFFGTEGEP
jgi:anhydro-N-acetylmuramic acid kinase